MNTGVEKTLFMFAGLSAYGAPWRKSPFARHNWRTEWEIMAWPTG